MKPDSLQIWIAASAVLFAVTLDILREKKNDQRWKIKYLKRVKKTVTEQY